MRIVLSLAFLVLLTCAGVSSAGGPGEMRIVSVRFPDRVSVSTGVTLQIPVTGIEDVRSVKKVCFTFLFYPTVSSMLRPGHAASVTHKYPGKLDRRVGVVSVSVPFSKEGERGGSCSIIYEDNAGVKQKTDPVFFPIFTVK